MVNLQDYGISLPPSIQVTHDRIINKHISVTAASTQVPAAKPEILVNSDTEARYKSLLSNLSEVFAIANRTYHVLGNMLQSRTFSASTEAERLFKDVDLSQLDRKTLYLPVNKLFVKGDFVETELAFQPIPCYLDINSSVDANAALKILKVYIPEFSLPPGSFGPLKVNERISLTELKRKCTVAPVTNAHALGALFGDKQYKPAYTPFSSEQKNAMYPTTTPKYEALHTPKNLVNFRFEVDLDNSTIIARSPGKTSVNGDYSLSPVPGSNVTYHLKLSILVSVVYRWPLELACFVTCVKTNQDFSPFQFARYLNLHKNYYTGESRVRDGKSTTAQSSKKPPYRISDFTKLKKQTEKSVQHETKTNPEGFLVIGTSSEALIGEVLYLDKTTDNSGAYTTAVASCYNSSTGELAAIPNNIKDKVIFLDKANNKLVYVNSNGNPTFFDLMGSKPLDNITIRNHLLTSIIDKTQASSEVDDSKKKKIRPNEIFFNRFCVLGAQFFNEQLIDLEIRRSPEMATFGKTLKSKKLGDIINLLVASTAKIVWLNLGNPETVGYRTSEGDLDSSHKVEYDREKFMCRIVKAVAIKLLANIDKLNIAYSTVVCSFRYQLTLIANYADDIKIYDNDNETAVVANTVKTAGYQSDKDIKVYNVPGVSLLMPHQRRFYSGTRNKPKNIILQADVGSGKTVLGTLLTTRLIAESNLKRVLVTCPGRLVRSWVSEVNKYSNGKINAVGLDTQVIKSLQKVVSGNDKVEPATLLSYMQNFPKNTIFIASFSFIRLQAFDLYYGEEIITRYPIAECLRDFNFEMLVIDESHNLKNPGTALSAATSVITSTINYIVLASGTVVNNVTSDLTGQMALINPAILGSRQKFIANYCSDIKGNELVPGAEDDISKLQAQYCYKESIKQRDFAFMLPDCRENLVACKLTPKQLKFYNVLVAKVLDEPTLKVQLEAIRTKKEDAHGNQATLKELEAQEEALLDKLKTRFQSVEEYLCDPFNFGSNPDSSTAPLRQEFIEFFGKSFEEEMKKLTTDLDQGKPLPPDFVSPKIAAITNLLEHHFKQYDPTKPASNDLVTKKGHKVIIFSYRVAAPKHIYANLPKKWQRKAVMYLAGDMAALDKFRDDPNTWILVAAVNSIKEGQNLQVADHLITTDEQWAPGDKIQIAGRIYRPDVARKYDRDIIDITHIYINNTLEVAKIARMVAKIINKRRYDELDNPDFNVVKNKLNAFDLPLIKMNFNAISAADTDFKIPEYLKAMRLIEDWEKVQFAKSRRDSNNKLVTLVPENHEEIPGSEVVDFAPRMVGIAPLDPDKQSLTPISVVQEIDETDETADEDDLEEEEIIKLKFGNDVKTASIVDTEYGIGYVVASKRHHVDVVIPGLPYYSTKVSLPKSTVFAFGNSAIEEKWRKKLIKAMATATGGIVRLPANLKVTKAEPVIKKSAPPPPDTPRPELRKVQKDDHVMVVDDSDTPESSSIDLRVSVINGSISLVINNVDFNEVMAYKQQGWFYVPSYLGVPLSNVKSVDNLFKFVESLGLRMEESSIKEFNKIKQAMKAGTLAKALTKSGYRDFVTYHRMPKFDDPEKGFINLHPVIEFDPLTHDKPIVLAAMNVRTTGSKKLEPKLKAKSLPGGGKFVEYPDSVVKGFATSVLAVAALKQLKSHLSDTDFKTILNEIKSIKVEQ